MEKELVQKAIEIMKDYKTPITTIQRKLQIGYHQARKIKEYIVKNNLLNKIEPHKIAVVGSRNFNDYELFKKIMDEFLQNFEKVEFISGGAKGADALAERYAKENNIPITIFYPNWKKYKKAAGYIRNKKIWEEADLGIAFWDGKSKGTTHSFKLAKKFNKDLYVFDFIKKEFIDISEY